MHSATALPLSIRDIN
ncbi:hypothetical protein YPPY91_1604, partial [Yersinia pestis PY-91]